MRSSELVASCMATVSSLRDMAVEAAKDDGVDEKDVLNLFMSAILCGTDASLMDMLEISMDDMLDKIVSKACAKKRG